MRAAEEAEFAEFFAATWSRLFRITCTLTGDVGQAEDALQSAFVKAYASWHRVRSAEQPEAYVRWIAVNEVLGVRRRLWWKLERIGLPPERMELCSLEDDLVDRTQMWAARRPAGAAKTDPASAAVRPHRGAELLPGPVGLREPRRGRRTAIGRATPSWDFTEGEIDAQLSFDGARVLYWSRCTEIGTVSTRSVDPIFIGNDM